MDIYESGQSSVLANYGAYVGQESEMHRDLDKMKKDDKKTIQEKGLSEQMLGDIYMIHSVVEELQAYIKEFMIPGMDFFDLRSMVTFSAGGKTMCLNTNVMYAEGKVHDNFNMQLNLNVEKLMNLSPMELRSVLSALIFGQLQNSKYMDNLADKMLLDEGTNSKEFQQSIKDKDDVVQYDNGLTDYFDGFLKDVNPFEDYDDDMTPSYTEPARIAARSMMFAKGKELYAAEHGTKALSDLLSGDKEVAKVELIALGAKAAFESMFSAESVAAGKSLPDARNDKLLDQHDAALANDDVYEAAKYSKQATMLVSARSKAAFANAKESDPASVEDLCVDYAKDFLEMFGFSGVEKGKFITFNPDASGDTGKFRKGPPASVNIALENNSSVVETLMSCAHELTHFLDSKSYSKQAQFAVEKDKGFRWDDLEQFSAAERKSPEYKILKRVDMMCYFMSPSEQSGRLGELKALRFLQSMSDGNYGLKVDIARNLETFQRQQKRTEEIFNGLNEKDSEYNLEELKKLKDQISNPRIKRMIEARLSFIEKISDPKSYDSSKTAIKESEELQASLGL